MKNSWWMPAAPGARQAVEALALLRELQTAMGARPPQKSPLKASADRKKMISVAAEQWHPGLVEALAHPGRWRRSLVQAADAAEVTSYHGAHILPPFRAWLPFVTTSIPVVCRRLSTRNLSNPNLECRLV
jgi:hypothetical protein